MAEPRYDIDGLELPPGTDGMSFEELVQAWREDDARILAEHDGDPDKANRALGLENMAIKMQDQAETNHALRDGTPARKVYDQVMAMDPVDMAAEYPFLPDDE